MLILRREANNSYHKIKFRSLRSFHMLYTMFIMEYIYFENLHLQSMAILGISVYIQIHIFCTDARLWMDIVRAVATVCECVCVSLRCEKPVFDLIKFILKFVAHRFRKQY